MPELPDLEIVAEFLNHRLGCARIEEVQVLKPIVVRDLSGAGFVPRLSGQCVEAVSRRGKFLLLRFASGDWLVINPMRAGRLRYLAPGERVAGKPFLALRFADGARLEYRDPYTMGKVYLTPDLEWVPTFGTLGPEALDPELTLDTFGERLRRRRGEIKGVLVNQSFVAGIGNAYADEILFRAAVYPFRKSPSLSKEEVRRVYEAMHAVLREAVEVLRQRIGQDIHVEVRDFLRIHGRGGQPCPRCGNPVSQITARGRLTNFCRTCQPGSMLGK
jgi:formamidopyrimidine-DNA glycosylase